MRILWIDNDGGNGSLAYLMRCIEDGHQVRWYFSKPRDTKAQPLGKGLVQIVPDWREWARWADVICLGDNTKHIKEVGYWRDRGTPVVGACLETAQWEMDRTLGQQIFNRCGIETADYKSFTDYDRAIAYVKKEMRRFVSKPLGDEEDKSLSYCSKDAADMVYMLERWKKAKRHKAGFILQEFVAGCEMAVGGFFGPGGFQEGWCENWEFKKLFPGDRGPATGEQGTILRFVKDSKLADLVLKPVEDELARCRYVGHVDVNCIIDEDGKPWPLEFTTRPGWPTWNIQQALNDGDHAEWLGALSDGLDAKPFSLNKVAAGVQMAIPDYPYSQNTKKEVVGMPLHGLTEKNRASVWPCEMMLGEAPVEQDGKISPAPILCTTGDYVLTATGTGEDVRQARSGAYKVLDQLSMPASPFWRTDIGQRLKKQLPEIQRHGYAKGMTF